MTNINPINFGIAGNPYLKNGEKEDLTKNTENKEKHVPEGNKQIESSKVLDFLAAQHADLLPAKPNKTIDVKKYVTPEQEARIAEFMKSFENDVEGVSAAAMAEFGDLSQGAADTLALAYINSTY